MNASRKLRIGWIAAFHFQYGAWFVCRGARCIATGSQPIEIAG